MKLRRLSPPVIVCALTALVLALGALGPFMRETDRKSTRLNSSHG